MVAAVLSMLFRLNTQFLVEIPQFGGELREGVVGSPRFVNPVLALSETDQDLTSLLYSGLMRVSSDGSLIPDLAESYEVSEDGLTYKFKIRNDATFHDGVAVSSDDIIYTINMIMDPVVKSPLRGNWEGVTLEKNSNTEITFYLPEPYSPFIYNTTLGILPKHIWQDVTPEEFAFNVHNTEPIGSGPYEIDSIRRNDSGIITLYNLQSFSDFALGRPYIKDLSITIFKNNEELLEAINNNKVQSAHTIHPSDAKKLEEGGINILSIPLPRMFGVFYNQNNAPVLSLKSLRRALDVSIDREAIVNEILNGYGSPANGVLPNSLVPSETQVSANADSETQTPLEEAKSILTNAGWELDENGNLFVETKDDTFYASFSIATNNVPELVAVGEKLVETWTKLGINVNLKVFETNDITNSVIRPREFEALLFGEAVGRDLDLYAFWHSSQRNDPGLNIAGYANISTDSLLEQAREISDQEERISKYKEIESEIKNDIPVSLVYSPSLIYALDKEVKADIPSTVTIPAERFTAVHNWYIETEKVWKIFSE